MSEISSPALEATLKDGIIKVPLWARFRYSISLTMITTMALLDHIDDYYYF